VGFDVAAEAYDRFMGRFATPLAEQFVELVGVQPGQVALDVGCGPGALTRLLVARLGVGSVRAVDPSEPFVAAAEARFPGLDVRLGGAERLPWPDDDVDLALAQLVVHFMADPVTGLAEMGRVTRPGGVVAASVWDHAAGGSGSLSTFWRAVRDLDPGARDESALPGSREGELAELFRSAGLAEPRSTALVVRLGFATLDDWWDPFLLGVGPAGAYVAGLDDEQRAALRSRCGELHGPAPFEVSARAWCVLATAG
jgi:SAM-dependent methyltransferase